MIKQVTLIEPSTGEKKITTFKYPPLGLLALASFLKDKCYEINFIDASIDNLDVEEIVERYKEKKTKVVGISSMSVNIGQTFEIAKKIKEHNPEVKIVVGGIHPTVMPEHTLGCPEIDVAVIGEGEITALELLQALGNSFDLDGILGIAYRKDGRVVINPRRPLISNLDDLPMADYSFLDVAKYRSPYAKRTPFISIVRSRGCVFNCTFCGNPKMFGRNFRCQSPERTILEIDALVEKYNIKEISFKDTELTLDKNLGRLCDLMIAKNYDIIWTCNGRVNTINQDLLEKMKVAGCYSITYGIESGDEEILKHMKKQITLEQVRRAIALTKKAGLQIVTNFMIGNAYDTKQTIEKTIQFAVELDTDYAYFGFTTPFPGTELRDLAEEKGWILDKRMEAIRYDECMMNATSLPTEELKKYLDKAYRAFYFRPRYILKRLRKLDRNELQNSISGLFKILGNRFTKNKKDDKGLKKIAIDSQAKPKEFGKKINSKSVLIIGGAGFIGSRIAQKLLARGYEVIIYDRFYNFLESEREKYVFYLRERLKDINSKVKIVYGDVRDENRILDTLRQYSPVTIIHLAQIPLATVSNKLSNEALDINVNGVTSLIKAIGAVSCVERLVYSSSSFVYGNFEYTPADEKHPTNPIDVYGGTKLASENIIKGFCTRFKIDYTIIRPSAVYGPTDANRRVSQIFVDNALSGKELFLEGGKECYLDFSYVDDVAEGFVLAVLSDKAKNEIFNITRGEARSLFEFVEILQQHIPDIEFTDKPADSTRPKRGALDISKAREFLGYEPKYSLEDGIKEYLDYLKEIDKTEDLKKKIPLCKPSVGKEELNKIKEVLDSGWMTDGPFNKEFEENFAKYIGVKYAQTVNSCASALFVVLKALDITGEVIIPSFTFMATANAVVAAGAKPVFADVDYKTGNLDVDKVESLISNKTQAIMPVHFAGLSCEMDRIVELCEKYNLKLIEDSAEAIGAIYKGRKTGSFGIGCFSFFPTKNITTGEGGMITTNDKELMDKIKILIAHGVNKNIKSEFKWQREAVLPGFNLRMSGVLAAMGIEQLKKIDKLNNLRREHAKYLSAGLDHNFFDVPEESEDYKHVYQMYTVKVDPKIRNRLVEELNAVGVDASVHFSPAVHQQELYKDDLKGDLINTEKLSNSIITLPMYPNLTQEDLDYIIEHCNKIIKKLKVKKYGKI